MRCYLRLRALVRNLVLGVALCACSDPGTAPDATSDGGQDAWTAPDAWVDPCDGVTAARVETVAMLSRGRYAPAVAALTGGRVLIAGGFDFTLGMTTSAEIYDAASQAVTPTGSLLVGRNFASTTVVAQGVLVIGGFDDRTGSVVAIERYDDGSGTFVPSEVALALGREAHTATALPDGRVLIAGGLQARGLRFQNSLELYDPASDTIRTLTSTLLPARGFHDAAWIASSESVLLVGGDSGMGELASGVRWAPATDELFTPGSARAHPGKAVALAALPSGHVIVAGGANGMDGTLADVDDYDPASDRFTPAAPMHVRRMAHTLTALGDGRLVAIGGWSDSEPGPAATPSIEVRGTDGAWTRLPVDLAVARLDHRAIALDACHVVVIGGQHAATGASPSAPLEIELVTIPR